MEVILCWLSLIRKVCWDWPWDNVVFGFALDLKLFLVRFEGNMKVSV